MSETISARKLTSTYGRLATQVLADYLEQVGAGRSKSYKILKPLPPPQDYKFLENQHFQRTVEDLISDANSEVDSLAEELREWYDNMPENLQSGDRGSRLEEAADTLEGLDKPEPEGELAEFKVVFRPGQKVTSRADRASEAANMYREVAQALRDFVEDQQEENKDFSGDDYEDLASTCENAADELESVEFPGAYG